MSKKDKVRFLPLKLLPLLGLLITGDLLLTSYLVFLFYFQGRIFPGVLVAGENLGYYTPNQASYFISAEVSNRTQTPLTISYQNQPLTLYLAEAQPQIDSVQVINTAYQFGRSGNILNNFKQQMQALFWGVSLPLHLNFAKEEIFQAQLDRLNSAVQKPSQDATLTLTNPITVSASQDGVELDRLLLTKQLKNYLTLQGPAPQLLTTTIQAGFNTEDANKAKLVLEAVGHSPIHLSYQNLSWTIDQPTLYKILNFHKTDPKLAQAQVAGTSIAISQVSIGQTQLSDNQIMIDHDKLNDFLSKIAAQIDQPVQEAKFKFEPGDGQTPAKVAEFQPAKEGLALDIDQTASLIDQDLDNNKLTDINLPTKAIQPQPTTENINNFGVKDLIGRGESNFAGSIDNRIYNIRLAASRINGTLIPPNQVFSFNNTVGDISGSSGYKQAYVIKSGRTVLDDGGGVCQVSTTVFRAALYSGLPITDRTAHAYRVGYYEQGYPPGLDATVFGPSVDFKFKNDTPGYVLIQAYTIGLSLYVDLYGTSDGRVALLSKPLVSGVTPPLPEVRQNDPTLAVGIVKQVDWPAWGAKVSFTRNVTRNNQTIIHETWTSNYQPWQAIYLVGTKS